MRYSSQLIDKEGNTDRENLSMSKQEVLDGVRRLLERDDFTELFLFKRHPLSASGDLNVHVHITKEVT